MELWVRSQDRTTLMKVDRLDIDYSSGLYLIKSDGFETTLAIYKTKERALEVLDEIQNILFYQKMSKDDFPTFAKIITEKYEEKTKNKIYMSTAVYEMPID